MSLKQSAIFMLVATLSLKTVAGNKLSSVEEANPALLNFMARSNDLMRINPLRSTECFNYYIPLIDKIAKTYQQNHDSCIQASRVGRSQAENATLDKRNSLSSSANDSCALLSECSKVESAGNAFECYANGGSENAKTMYVINVNASNHLSDLQEEIRLVESKEYKCTNDTKRQYEKDSTKAYEGFNKCILGGIVVPTPTEAPVENESTKEPESTKGTTKVPLETDPTEGLESNENS